MNNIKTKQLDDLRHSCAHLLAAAVTNIWPEAKPTIGPSIENGFYYDFDFGETKISDKDLPKIEKEMKKIVSSWKNFKKIPVNKKEANSQFKNNVYKLELIKEFSEEKKDLTIYQSGDFKDLCRGGHVKEPFKDLIHFKLLKIAGAYWRGSEKNNMLTRIYGTCWPSEKELLDYLEQIKEAEKRDHRILGKQLELYVINDVIGKGLPLLTPKGTVIRNEIIKLERELEKEYEFTEVWTPHIAKSDIYKKTGHWQHYKDTMYAPFGIDDEQYVLKPMNCPHHYMIYASKPRSYKDLPIRLSEQGTCYRYEKSGELGGLTRVRALSIDDAHILMRDDQVEDEFKRNIEMVIKIFEAFGLTNYYVRLSLGDPDDNVKYISDEKTWENAGARLEDIVRKNKLDYVVEKGEASFYGPKIDFMVKDSLGREWQMSTLQLDLFMSEKLDLIYVDKDGGKKHPVILHRGLTGSLERTIGILIEHYAGAFPVWLSPLQVKILPITQRNEKYANTLKKLFNEKDIRTEVDDRSETLQAKIRDAQIEKVPYMIIVGDKEEKAKNISVRLRSEKDLGQITTDNFIKRIETVIDTKSLKL